MAARSATSARWSLTSSTARRRWHSSSWARASPFGLPAWIGPPGVERGGVRLAVGDHGLVDRPVRLDHGGAGAGDVGRPGP
jgi:hypothetical protein